MIDLAEFTRLKSRADQLQAQADRAAGALDQAMSRLKEEGCDSVEQAKKLQVKLDREVARAEQEYQAALKTFEKQWGEKLQ